MLVEINNGSKNTPDYIYFTMHGTATVTPVQAYLIVYGVNELSDSVDSAVYDNINDQMFEYKWDMQMQTDIDINNETITNLANPVNDQDAVSLTSVRQYILEWVLIVILI